MEFWPEFLASSFGKELVAGGIGGMAGVLSGHPFDTLRVRLQQPPTLLAAAAPATTTTTSVAPPARAGGVTLLRSILASEGPGALYRGMAAPLASVTLQNAMVFQAHAILSRALDPSSTDEPPSYQSVALAGFGTGAVQSFLLSPVELLKIRLQLQTLDGPTGGHRRLGPVAMSRDILRNEGLRGLYRGVVITVLRDAPAFGVYFWAYEYAKELLHPGCRRSGEEGLRTMLVSGGLAGVASWVCCYPLDVVKSRLQAQTRSTALPKYSGIADCVRKSVEEEGLAVLFRGLGTAVTRAFVVNGAIFTAYELALRFIVSNNPKRLTTEEK